MDEEKIRKGKLCQYCFIPTVFISNRIISNFKGPRRIWYCPKCGAYVGVHKNSNRALGTVANSRLRTERQYAHYHFDKLWKIKQKRGFPNARKLAYDWLSKEMGIALEHTHIAMFNIDQCRKVVELCKPYLEKLKKKNKV